VLARAPEFSNFEDVKEKIFRRGLRGRHFDAPRAWHHVLSVRWLNSGKVGTPKCLPHSPEFRIFGQRGPLLWLQRPIFAATPRAAMVIARAIEVSTRSTAARYHAIARQERMYQ
jgi:hypothetical protein